MKWKKTAPRVVPLVAVASVSLVIAGLAGAAMIMGLLPVSRVAPAAPLAVAEAPQPRVVHHHREEGRNSSHQKHHRPTLPAPQPEQAEYVRVGISAVVGGLLGKQVGSGNGREGETVVGLLGGYARNQPADGAR